MLRRSMPLGMSSVTLHVTLRVTLRVTLDMAGIIFTVPAACIALNDSHSMICRGQGPPMPGWHINEPRCGGLGLGPGSDRSGDRRTCRWLAVCPAAG